MAGTGRWPRTERRCALYCAGPDENKPRWCVCVCVCVCVVCVFGVGRDPSESQRSREDRHLNTQILNVTAGPQLSTGPPRRPGPLPGPPGGVDRLPGQRWQAGDGIGEGWHRATRVWPAGPGSRSSRSSRRPCTTATAPAMATDTARLRPRPQPPRRRRAAAPPRSAPALGPAARSAPSAGRAAAAVEAHLANLGASRAGLWLWVRTRVCTEEQVCAHVRDGWECK